MRPLYEMTAQFQYLMESADDDEQFALRLSELEGEIEQKAQGVAVVLNSLKSEEMALDTEIDRLTARRKRARSAQDRLTKYIQDNMERMNATRLQGGTFEFKIQQNPESVLVMDESAVPDECKKSTTTVTVDKRLVLEMYKKHGEIAPGCNVVRTTRLVIK
jgi:hypothetical protein